MAPTVETVRVSAMVHPNVAKALEFKAQQHERSTAAEIRLALRAWLDADDDTETAA